MNKITFKRVKTIKEFKANNYFGYDIIVPVGSIVTNKTACGYDDDYRYWEDWQECAEKLTGFKNSCLAHDLTYHGINIPAEYCEPYPKN